MKTRGGWQAGERSLGHLLSPSQPLVAHLVLDQGVETFFPGTLHLSVSKEYHQHPLLGTTVLNSAKQRKQTE